MNDKVKLYMEYLDRKKITHNDLTPLPENQQTWFDVFINHPKFIELFKSLILTNDYYKKPGEYYDFMDNFQIINIKKLTHPQLGPILKIDTTWDKIKYDYRSEKSHKTGEIIKVFYLNGIEFLNYFDCLSESLYSIDDAHNSDYFAILKKLNKSKKIDDKTYEEYYKERVERLLIFDHFDTLAKHHKEVKKSKENLEGKLNSVELILNNKIKDFKKHSDAYQLLKNKNNPTM